jgi:hypothetical protein
VRWRGLRAHPCHPHGEAQDSGHLQGRIKRSRLQETQQILEALQMTALLSSRHDGLGTAAFVLWLGASPMESRVA